jgi:hypothetical protein
VAYLDISPMLAAMREQPDGFSLSNGWLRHHPSNHRFKVQADGFVIIDAECGCAALSVHTEQGLQLYDALETWRAEYWVPREINQHFARHFRPPSVWRRWLRKARAYLTQYLDNSASAIYDRPWSDSGQPVRPRGDNALTSGRTAKPDLPLSAAPPPNIRREPEDTTV